MLPKRPLPPGSHRLASERPCWRQKSSLKAPPPGILGSLFFSPCQLPFSVYRGVVSSRWCERARRRQTPVLPVSRDFGTTGDSRKSHIDTRPPRREAIASTAAMRLIWVLILALASISVAQKYRVGNNPACAVRTPQARCHQPTRLLDPALTRFPDPMYHGRFQDSKLLRHRRELRVSQPRIPRSCRRLYLGELHL